MTLMGITAKRLRQRAGLGAVRPPPEPSTISRTEHNGIVQELQVRYERELSELRTRVAALTAELGLLKRPITKPPPKDEGAPKGKDEPKAKEAGESQGESAADKPKAKATPSPKKPPRR